MAVVLGAGMVGTVVAQELVASDRFQAVRVVDSSPAALEKCEEKCHGLMVGEIADLGNPVNLACAMGGAEVAVAALPHSLSMAATAAAIKAGCHLIDLVGSEYEAKSSYHTEAQAAGVLIVPGCGVAPGITNVLAARATDMLEETDDITMLCGGLPEDPLPPLWYQVVFRLESVMGLYTRPARAIVDGRLTELPPLSGLERYTFPPPVGECEAAVSDAHSVAYTLQGKVRHLVEKTVRYAGHFQKMGVLAELGLLGTQPVQVGTCSVRPRDVTMAVLEPLLRGRSERDVTVLRVTATGRKGDRQVSYVWEMVDRYDKERSITSMAKTTGFPAAVVADWIATRRLQERGVVPPELLIRGERFDAFMVELARKGIDISFRETEQSAA